MRYELGTVSIDNLPQLYNARTNLYTLINRIGNNPVLAASVSAGLSQASRKLLQKGLPFMLSVNLDTNEAGSATLTFELSTQSGHDESIFTSSLFTSVRAPQISGKKYRQKASLRLPLHLALTENTLSELRTQLQMKGRDELISEVRSKNAELQESLENLKRTRSAKERMESELNIGRDIQMGMLPLSFPAFPGRKEIDVYALLNPAREVGGDFYDFFFVDENHLCFCAGDVSGKGVPAALFMAMTKTLIKSRAADDSSTASIITHVNDELSEDNQVHRDFRSCK